MPRLILLLFYAIYFSQCTLPTTQIDLLGCKEATACFVRESCIVGKSDLKALADFKYEKLKNGNCDVIIQIRAFTGKKYLIMMLVNYTDSSETIANTGVSLKQGVDQFSCTDKGPTANLLLFKEPTDKFHSYDKKRVFCSFALESSNGLDISHKFFDNLVKQILVFTTTHKEQFVYATIKNVFWEKALESFCNPEMLTSSDSMADGYLAEKINTASYAPITCVPGKSLIITRTNEPPINLDIGQSLHCVENKWNYLDKPIPETEMFNVACGVKFCSLCPPLNLTCPGCTAPPEDTCKTATCPNNQWKTEDGKLLTGEMECKQEIENANSPDAFWYLKDGTKITSNAACFDKSVCWKEASLNKTCPFNNCDLIKSNDEGTELTCHEGFSINGTSTVLHCDFATGLYKDGQAQLIDATTNIHCAALPSSAAIRKDVLMYVVGGGSAFLVIVAVITFFVCRRKNRKSEKKSQHTIAIGGESQETPSRGTDRFSVRDESVKQSVAEPPKPPPKPPTNSKLPSLPDGPITPWLMRMRKKNLMKLADNFWPKFTEDRFQAEVLPMYSNLSAKSRKEVFYMVTGMDAYAQKKENKKAYGHIRHFFELLKVCQLHQLDDILIWEKNWRFVRMLEDVVMKPKNYKDSKNLCARMKSIMVKIARPIFNELGWTMMTNEDAKDTRMRFFVVRVLMWAEECDVIAELTRLSSLPLTEVEAPIRPVVLAFAVRKGRGAEIKQRYWKTVLEDPRNPAMDKFGTLRQHVLYGLASKTSGNEQEMRVTKETLAALYDHSNMATSFTPFDIYWAWLGATDYSTKAAIDLFILTTKSFKAEDAMYDQIHAKFPNFTEDQLKPHKDQWKDTIVDTMDLLAECASNKDQYFKQLLSALLPFDWCLEAGVLQLKGHDSELFDARTANMDGFNKELKRDLILDEAIKRIENC